MHLPSEQRVPLASGVLSACVLGWCSFVDLQTGPAEACRVLAGLTCLWLPIGSVVYLLLRDRCSDTLTRCTLSAASSFGLTGPLYLAFGLCGLVWPGFDRMFCVAQALTLLGVLIYLVRRRRICRAAELRDAWRKLDWTLMLLIALSVLVNHRYKGTYVVEPDQGTHRIVAHGDATYLASLAYELDRRTPAAEQPARAGLKERAYHMFPHLNTMLIARYTAQPDMLRALTHYHFTVAEVLLCLTIFCIVRRITSSRAAGYTAVALLYILAIPLAPIGRYEKWYFYFTWHTHTTSNLEPTVLCSPQTYCALPVVFGILLFVLQLSVQLSGRRAAGVLAVLAGLMTAVLMRFRVQAFLILFPGMIALLGIAWYQTRQRVFIAAGCLAALVTGGQLLEMQLPLYYPDTASLQFSNNHLARDCIFFQAWPGALAVRGALERGLSPEIYDPIWQIACLTIFALANIAGLPVVIASGFHFFRKRTWQAETWAYSGMVLWLLLGTIGGGTCLSTTYDSYSVGGQSLFLVGWYLLPLLTVGLWQAGQLLPLRVSHFQKHATVVAVLVLAAACTWQRVRPHSNHQEGTFYGGSVLSDEEWAAMQYMREHLPVDAVILSKVTHHHPNYCTVSAVTGRRTFVEYACLAGYPSGGPEDQPPARIARVDRVWAADDTQHFAAAVLDTGATHLVEYAEHPLRWHPSDCLEEFWSSPTGAVKVWTFHRPKSTEPLRMADLKGFDPCRAL